MDVDRILEDLDKLAVDFNFPVLDNANIEFAGARLSAYRGVQDWLVVFEVLGFSTPEIQFVDDIYAFGSCLAKEGFIGEDIPLASTEGAPLFNAETNDCIADWRRWSIKLRGRSLSFCPTLDEYRQAGLDIVGDGGLGSLKEIDLLRFLVHRLDAEQIFMDDRMLLNYFPLCKNISKFIQTTQWNHPDVAAEEKPSENISVRSLILALSQRDPSLFNRGRPNTHWKFWGERFL